MDKDKKILIVTKDRKIKFRRYLTDHLIFQISQIYQFADHNHYVSKLERETYDVVVIDGELLNLYSQDLHKYACMTLKRTATIPRFVCVWGDLSISGIEYIREEFAEFIKKVLRGENPVNA